MSLIDKERIKNKYKKIRKERGPIATFLYIIFFIVRDLTNNLLVFFIETSSILDNRNILFIEPVNQGYGDIFFQTALFESLNKKGYKISILINRKHSEILENNPFINELYFWRMTDLLKILKSRVVLIGLGRSTLRENTLLFFSRNKIILDKNIDVWKDIFKNNPNTIAWIKIFEYYLKINLKYLVPQIVFSEKEKEWIKQKKSENKIGVIYGISKKTKRFTEIEKLIELIPSHYEIVLLGINSKYSGARNVSNLTGIGYRKTILELATCAIVIGTEGSLTQISSSLPIKTFVIDSDNRFAQNTHPAFIKKVFVFKEPNALDGFLDNL